MNNKKTYLLIGAMQRAQGDDAIELRRWLNDSYAIRDKKVPAVRALYERLGVRQAANAAIEHYNALALEALSKADLPRTYVEYGKANLGDKDWTPVKDANRAAMRFFKVGVEIK